MTRLLLFLALTPAVLLAQDQYFDSNGVRIRYVDQGSGVPIILIHGLSGDVERNWIDTGVLPALAKNFRVIALDYRGHGKSGKVHNPKAYGIEMGRDVLRLMDHLKIARAHMVGYSLGGHIVAKLLTTNPERFLTATLGGSAGARRMIPDEAIERIATEFEGETPMRSLVLGFIPKGESPPDNETIRRFVGGNDVSALAAVIRSWNGLVATEAQLKAVGIPTLAITGTADPVIEDLNVLKRAWPSLHVITIDGGTHSNIIPAGRGTAARPEFVNAIRDFIARQAFQETPSEPNKIRASTPYEFNAKNLTAYGGLLPDSDDAGEVGIPELGRRDDHVQSGNSSDEPVQLGNMPIGKLSPKTDADEQCEFDYQPDGWKKACRFVALRYAQRRGKGTGGHKLQYQLFETRPYKYHVVVTNFDEPIHLVVGFYNPARCRREPDQRSQQRCRIGGAAHPSGPFRRQPDSFSDGHAGPQPERLAHAL